MFVANRARVIFTLFLLMWGCGPRHVLTDQSSTDFKKRVASFALTPDGAAMIAHDAMLRDGRRLHLDTTEPARLYRRWYVFTAFSKLPTGFNGYFVNGDDGTVTFNHAIDRLDDDNPARLR